MPIGKFHGIGPATAEKMHRLGIQNGSDLVRQTLPFLQQHFGKSATWYYNISRGENHREVKPNRVRKSSGSETTFAQDLSDLAAIEAKVIEMADDVWEWCTKADTYGRTVTVKIKYGDFTQVTRSHSFPTLLTTQNLLQQISLELIRSVFPLRSAVRLVGVTISNFNSKIDEADLQLDLLSCHKS